MSAEPGDQWFAFWIFISLISGAIGAMAGSRKKNAVIGFMLGAVFGLIGWIVAAVLPERKEQEVSAGARLAMLILVGASLFAGLWFYCLVQGVPLGRWASAPPELEAPAMTAQTPTPGPEKIPEVVKSDLVVIHGRVEYASPLVLIVRCISQDQEAQGFAGLITAGTGASAAKRLGGLAQRQERDTYGPLMEIRGNQLMEAAWTPSMRATGRVHLEGHPGGASLMRDAGVHVIAARINSETFTMRYRLRGTAAEPAPVSGSGAWMWNRPGARNPLERRAR